MTTSYILLKDAGDASSCPVFQIKIGQSARDQRALAEISVLALVSDEIFFCQATNDVRAFVQRLLWQNPSRPFYKVSAPKMRAILKGHANAADVENLSDEVSGRMIYQAVASHDDEKLKLLSQQTIEYYVNVIRNRKSRRGCREEK